jgi:hypothetical protein
MFVAALMQSAANAADSGPVADPAAAEAAQLEALGLSDEAIPFDKLGEDFIVRPRPVTEALEDALFPANRERNRILRDRDNGIHGMGVELPERVNLFGGSPFLGRGEIYKGFEIPTGAVWQPVFLLYGEYRTSLQSFNNGAVDVSEWANRLDLFGNLYLTPTERLLFQFRPLDDQGDFTGYNIRGGGRDKGFYETFNARVRSLFFEGDFGELFPKLDPNDEKNLDYGFSIGRQPLSFQDGILLNDSIDSIGITRSSLFSFGANASRITGYFGLNEVHRNDNLRDDDAKIYGLSYFADYEKSSYELDVAYVSGSDSSGGDGLYAGIGQTRRFGHWNSTLRLNGSWALDEETEAVSTGGLLTSQLSKTMTYNDDIFYINSFLGVEDYSSAARDPSVGGPLGPVGILYDSPGIGEYTAPLGNRVGESIGFGLGYQHFFDATKKSQLIFELGGRLANDDDGQSSVGLGARYQKGIGRHHILVLDAFGAAYDDPALDDFGYGVRAEWRIKF